MKKNKLMALLLAVVMVVSLAACKGGSTSSTASKADASSTGVKSDLSEPGKLPIWQGEGTPEVSILLTENQWVTSFEDNEYTKWIEKTCNVKLTFVMLPAAETATVLTTRVTGGDQLPDVICRGLDLATEKSYADAGAILDLTPYYEKGLAYNVDKAVKENPTMNLLSNITTAEGKVYATPKLQASPSNEVKFKMWINNGWLTNVGLKIDDIKTTADFQNMLQKFKNEDANKNGDKNDELPFCTAEGWGGTAYKYLTNAFVFEGDNDMLMLKDGKVVASYMQDAWFDSCDYIKGLVDAGLLTSDSFTLNNDGVKTILESKGDVIGAITNSSCSYLGGGKLDDPKNEIRARYVTLNPLTGPNGVCYASYAQSGTQGLWHVTKYAKNPELCFRLGDFQFTEEGFLLGRFGVEGVNWDTAANYTKAHAVTLAAYYGTMGFEGKYVFYNDIFGKAQNLNWYDQMAYFSGNVEAEGAYVAKNENGVEVNLSNDATVRQNTATGYYQLKKPDATVYCPNLHFTEEETEKIADIQAQLKKFVAQDRVAYYTSQDSTLKNGKEAFLKELKTIGIDQFLEVCNTAYQRQYGKK